MNIISNGGDMPRSAERLGQISIQVRIEQDDGNYALQLIPILAINAYMASLGKRSPKQGTFPVYNPGTGGSDSQPSYFEVPEV